MRYIVAYFDTNGVGRLIGGEHDFQDYADARNRIADIKRSHTKPHKVDYRVIPYEQGRKQKTLAEHGVVI